MRIANLAGRVALLFGDEALDIAEASEGRFGPDPMSLYADWDAFLAWAPGATGTRRPWAPDELDIPVPRPAQVFAIGLNYADHAAEAGLPLPEHPVVFTKFQSSLAAPNATVELPSDDVDYETEVVAVIGRAARRVTRDVAWDHVAGLAIGQDYSERTVQRRGPAAQFSLGKSFPGFGPFGPAVVTLDELPDRDALRLRATLRRPGSNLDEVLQNGTTDDMIFDIPETIARLSEIVTLLPGDLIFTGTPAGVGLGRGILMRPGYIVTSSLEGVGEIRNEFVAATSVRTA